MFGKKCPRCKNKIKDKYEFCPYCGLHFDEYEDEKDYGLLGKKDLDDSMFSNFGKFNIKMPFGDSLFNSLLKTLDKQLRELDREIGKNNNEIKKQRSPDIRSSGISISISSSGDKPPVIKVNRFGDNTERIMEAEEFEQEKEKKLPIISEEKAKKIASLPRKEANTKLRRLANKLVYEIDLPGVDSIKDIVVNKLENSIEMKAFAKDKVFVKLIPIKMPLLNYKLKNEKLVLEFKG